jgi:hypothetical protein
MEDGNELSKTYHRNSLTPGQDLTNIPANVAAICNVAWTEEVIAAYQAQVAEQALITQLTARITALEET